MVLSLLPLKPLVKLPVISVEHDLVQKVNTVAHSLEYQLILDCIQSCFTSLQIQDTSLISRWKCWNNAYINFPQLPLTNMFSNNM